MAEIRTEPHELGRLRPPFPVDSCANCDCPHDADLSTLNEHGAYLYTDLETTKLSVFCGDCARYVELVASHRWKLIAL